jgi:hypothetical protein
MKKGNISISEIEHLLGAIKVCIQQGGNFLVNRCAPNGPIMRERNLDYIHKPTWGMYSAGVDHSIVAKLLDWAMENALQPSGDFYFPEEGDEYKITQRAYRPLNFVRVAVLIGHPMMKNDKVIKRLMQYQHKSGGTFNYIGDNPDKIEEQPEMGLLNSTFMGHLMMDLGIKDKAILAGDWLCKFVQANKDYMKNDKVMYTNMTPDGKLVTTVKPGKKISSLVDNIAPAQEFWQIGTTIAYLTDLYEKMVEDWGYSEDKAQVYLDNAFLLLDFEDTMPLYTYLWPSKCKVGWGAGEILRVMLKFGKGTDDYIEKAYRAAKKVAIFTFMDNQLATGGWSCMHYPLSELIPEIAFEYKPLKGIVNVPYSRIEGSQTIFLSGEEITGEFLGEIKAIQIGLEELLAHKTK